MRQFSISLVLLVLLTPLAPGGEGLGVRGKDDDAKPVTVKIFGVSAIAPPAWVEEKPDNLLRSYQFKVPSIDKDQPAGEVAIYKLGSPKTETLFPEWKATFTPPKGKTIDEASRITTVELNNGKATLLDVRGTWKFRDRPRDPRSKLEIRPDYRVIWVVLTIGDESTHIRFSGPDKLVAKHRDTFVTWLKTLK